MPSTIFNQPGISCPSPKRQSPVRTALGPAPPHAVAAEPGLVEQALALGVIVIAALVEPVGEVGVAVGDQPGAGRYFTA